MPRLALIVLCRNVSTSLLAGLPGSQLFNFNAMVNTLTALSLPNEESARDIYKASHYYFSFQWNLNLLGGTCFVPGTVEGSGHRGWRHG